MVSGEAEVAAKSSYSPRGAFGADWLAAPSRFVAWSRPFALFALLLIAVVELTGLMTPPVPMKAGLAAQASATSATSLDDRDPDLVLYHRVIEGIRDGGAYYSVV